MITWRRVTAAGSAVVLARHLAGLWQLHRTLAWLADRGETAEVLSAQASPVRLHLVVAMLWEQEHAAAAVDWFSQLLGQFPQTTLTVVTSAREDLEREMIAVQVASGSPVTCGRYPQLSDVVREQLDRVQHSGADRDAIAAVLDTAGSTQAAVDRALVGNSLAGGPTPRLRHLHYPGTGRKAAQVNYAAAQLGLSGHDFLLVYDVDSRPQAPALSATLAAATRLTPVVQQPAVFLSENGENGKPTAIGSGTALLQSLWTLRREVPALRRYARATQPVGGRTVVYGVLAQMAGHGLAVRADVFTQLGGLPEHARLDDLAFGFTVTAHRVPVELVPAVTVASSPAHAGAVVDQHRRWFGGYLDYPGQARRARATGEVPAVRTMGALAVGGYRAGVWLAAGPATAACTAALLHRRSGTAVRLLAAAALLTGCAVPLAMLARHPHLAARLGLHTTATGLATAAGQVWAAYLIRSIGPAQALVAVLTPARFGQSGLSGRTARRPAGATR